MSICKNIHMSGLQVNNKKISVTNLMDSDWNINFEGIGLTNAHFFKMHLSTLRTMAEEEETMAALYNKLIECAKVPGKVSENYCLLFMFSAE